MARAPGIARSTRGSACIDAGTRSAGRDPSSITVSATLISSARWVACTTVGPPSDGRRRSSESSRSRPDGSSIAVDSSEISSAGRRASAAATASRWSCPPDRVLVSRSPKPASPTDASIASTSTAFGPAPEAEPTGSPQTTSSRTRTPSTWLSGRWNTSAVPPARPRPTGPGRCIAPDDGAAPASRRVNVDLPAPLGPVTATNRCAGIVGAQPDERVDVRTRIAEADVDELHRHRRGFAIIRGRRARRRRAAGRGVPRRGGRRPCAPTRT